MSTRAYVDTNVFIDFFEDRDSAAYRFFRAALQCKYYIIVSDLVLIEASSRHGNAMRNFLNTFERAEKLQIIRYTDKTKTRAKEILRQGTTHDADATHIAFAEEAAVDVIVTKNIKDFRHATTLPVKRPDAL